jgi:hypothetical protein
MFESLSLYKHRTWRLQVIDETVSTTLPRDLLADNLSSWWDIARKPPCDVIIDKPHGSAIKRLFLFWRELINWRQLNSINEKGSADETAELKESSWHWRTQPRDSISDINNDDYVDSIDDATRCAS